MQTPWLSDGTPIPERLVAYLKARPRLVGTVITARPYSEGAIAERGVRKGELHVGSVWQHHAPWREGERRSKRRSAPRLTNLAHCQASAWDMQGLCMGYARAVHGIAAIVTAVAVQCRTSIAIDVLRLQRQRKRIICPGSNQSLPRAGLGSVRLALRSDG